MPAGKLEIVRSMYRALAAGDTAALLAAFDPNAAVEQPEVDAESYRGQNGVLAWAERWRDALHGLELQTRNFVEADDYVVVLSRFVAHEQPGREAAEAHFAHVWRVKAGTVREVRLYLDWKAAMQAAGFRD